jgi:hypothetical protein
LVGGEPPELLVSFLALKLLVNNSDLLPLLLGEDCCLPDFEDSVCLRVLKALDNLPVHVSEQQVGHFLELYCEKAQQVAGFYLFQV